MNRAVGFFVIASGICVLLIGLLIYSGGLNWFGHLPGDIRHEGERVQLYVPIVSMLVISLVLSLILYLIRRFF
jgi:xanthine/uracil permease